MIPGIKYPFVKLQSFHIVSGSHDTYGSIKEKYGYTYYIPKLQNQAEDWNYIRVFLFCDIDSRTDQVVYMIKVNSPSERIWGLNSQLRDNSVLTIGSYITIFNPLHILNRLGNEIPIIKFRHSAVITDLPRIVHSVCVEFWSVQNNTRDFVFNNLHITINSSFPEVIKCPWLLCDQKCAREVLQENRGYECY